MLASAASGCFRITSQVGAFNSLPSANCFQVTLTSLSRTTVKCLGWTAGPAPSPLPIFQTPQPRTHGCKASLAAHFHPQPIPDTVCSCTGVCLLLTLQVPCTAAQRRDGRPRTGAHAGQEGEAFFGTVLCGERTAFRSKATDLIEGLESPHRTFQKP